LTDELDLPVLWHLRRVMDTWPGVTPLIATIAPGDLSAPLTAPCRDSACPEIRDLKAFRAIHRFSKDQLVAGSVSGIRCATYCRRTQERPQLITEITSGHGLPSLCWCRWKV